MKRLRLLILAIGVLVGGSAALADDLSLGGNYVNVIVDESSLVGTPGNLTGVTNVGGGPITISSLNGATLAYVYCVGFFTDVYVPDDYSNTSVNNDGYVNGAFVNNDGEIAWLLDHYASASLIQATKPGGDQNGEQALQAAIWTVEYDGAGVNSLLPTITGDAGQSYYSQYTADLTALGWIGGGPLQTAALSTIDWFSPDNGSGTMYQGLVGPHTAGAVPEPTGIVLLGTLLLFSVRLMKRKKIGASR